MVPKFLNRRFALVTGLAVLSAVAFAPKASAQTADVLFDSTVPSNCAFGTPTNGTLTAAGDTFTTTTNGTVTLSCNSALSTLAIAAPVADAATLLALGTPTASTSQVTGTNVNGGTPITNVIGATAIGAVITNEALNVQMTSQHAAAIPAGTYQFSVTLTAAAL